MSECWHQESGMFGVRQPPGLLAGMACSSTQDIGERGNSVGGLHTSYSYIHWFFLIYSSDPYNIETF